jgi:hypothetical protein
MTNEIIYGIWNLVVLLILFILVKFMTKGNKKVDTKGRYDFLHSLIAIVAFLMIGVLATYVFHPRPLFPTPHVTMVALIIFYVFLFEKRDFKSLGISIQNMGESVTVGLAIGIILFLNVAIINIMYVRGSGIADSFVYFVNNFDLTFCRTHSLCLDRIF